MFDFLRKPKGEAKINGTDKLTIGLNNTPVNKIENVTATQKPPAEPNPYNAATMLEINKRINCVLKLKPEISHNLQKINFDRKIKCRWKDAEMLGISSGLEVTEEEFWLAYIRGYVKNVIKKEDYKNKVLRESLALDNTIALIDQKISQLNGVSDFIPCMHDKINGMDARQQEFVKGFLSRIGEKPALKAVENVFVCDGKEYPATPKMKRILLELSKGSGWTTAKKLSELTPENEAYICCTLSRLMYKGYPIISYTSSGKRFWALERGKKEKGEKGNISPEKSENKPELLLHALRQYKELNGRPPTASEISDQLKWDIIYVKNELKRLSLNGKIKDEKIFINGKTIKVWIAEGK